jgi:hypothetical protein
VSRRTKIILIAVAALALAYVFVPCPCILKAIWIPPDTRAFIGLKGRGVPPASAYDRRVTLENMLLPGDDHDRWSSSNAASVEGFVVDVQPGGIELSNCFTLTDRDAHIDLALDVKAPAIRRVIVEVTPASRAWARAHGWDWSSGALRRDLVGKQCRFDGWLLWDQSHEDQAENSRPGYYGNWRATAWEIHPVTAIHCKN